MLARAPGCLQISGPDIADGGMVARETPDTVPEELMSEMGGEWTIANRRKMGREAAPTVLDVTHS
jgi:hypothetical protein